jgi:TRAP-type mannitol/chloroaromatic compound transport system permease small subunit
METDSMKRFLHSVDQLSNWFGWFCVYLTLLCTAIVLINVVTRYGFNYPIRWIPELSWFLYGAGFMLSGACALRWGDHVRVDILVKRFSLRKQAIIEAITSVAFWLFCGTLLYQGARMAWGSLSILETAGTYWDPPLCPIKMVIPLSALLLLLQGAAKLIRDLNIAIKGKDIDGD